MTREEGKAFHEDLMRKAEVAQQACKHPNRISGPMELSNGDNFYICTWCQKEWRNL